MIEEEENRWELIYTTDMEYKVMIATELLAENEIVSHFINKQDSNYLLGSFDLFVRPDSVIKAKFIIEKSNL